MPKIEIEHHSSQDREQTLNSLKTFFENDQDLKKLDSKIQVHFDPNGQGGKISGSQFKADLKIAPGGTQGGCTLKLVVDLPLLLSPFKGKIQQLVEKKLKTHLA